MSQRVSAREFVGRLKGAVEGLVQEELFSGEFQIRLIVTKPEKASGDFLAPDLDKFNYDFNWYSAFYGEVCRLASMTPEERTKARLYVKLPWIEGLENRALEE